MPSTEMPLQKGIHRRKFDMRVYRIDEIQTVYSRHKHNCGTVLYSENGYDWHSVGMDSGKWDINNWIFAFIELI